MKKILMGLAAALMLFVLLIVVFSFIFFFTEAVGVAAEGEACWRRGDWGEGCGAETGCERAGDVLSRGCGFRIRRGMQQGVFV